MNNPLQTTEGFSSNSQTMAVTETASMAIAAQAKAMVEARYVMAMRNPRNWDQVRTDLLKECRRPTFANNKSAYYIKPIGAGVEGLGIRFVEVALRCMKNVLIETTMMFEDDQKEIHRVSVTDLESNVTYPLDVKVTKTVERSKPESDGSFLRVRKNSRGKNTYTISAQDDDLLNKRGAMISKAVRTLGLRIIPGDMCDEAEDIIKSIRLDTTSKDPESAKKKMIDSFSDIGVSATNIVDYLGHSIEQCSPTQITDLRAIYGAINDGESSWKSVMDNKQDNHSDENKSQAGSILESIKKANSIKEIEALTVEIEKLTDSEKNKVRKVWLEKSNKLKITSNDNDTDFNYLLKKCSSIEELNLLIQKMPEKYQLELGDEIDEKYDSLR